MLQNKLNVFCCPFFRTLSRPSTHARCWVWCRARVQGHSRPCTRTQKSRAPGYCVLTVLGEFLGQSTALCSLLSLCFKMALACSRLQDMVKRRSVKRCQKKCKNARALGRDRALFPESRASYFRSARFNTSPLYYLRAWHRLKWRQLGPFGVAMYTVAYRVSTQGVTQHHCLERGLCKSLPISSFISPKRVISLLV